jgi:hypothetical protein
MHHGHEKEFAGVGLSFRPEFEGFWPSIKSNLDSMHAISEEVIALAREALSRSSAAFIVIECDNNDATVVS